MEYMYHDEIKNASLLNDYLWCISLKNKNVLVDTDVDRYIETYGYTFHSECILHLCIKEYDPFNPYLVYVYIW